jgi:RES domain-containing protein
MELFRISKKAIADNLRSSGRQNRWNHDGQYVIYTGSSRSLSTLEMVVHRNSISILDNYLMMLISVPDNESLVKEVIPAKLPVQWRSMAAYGALQHLGSAWYESQDSLLLKVPSAVIPKEYNYIINTRHPDFSNKISLLKREDYFWDKRLL